VSFFLGFFIFLVSSSCDQELIEATEGPGSRLASLFEAEVVPPADNEGL
jgi:hypothetical protein